MSRAVNRNRFPDCTIPGNVDTYTCVDCDRSVPKGGRHVRIKGFDGCMVMHVFYCCGPDGQPARNHQGLPIIERVTMEWA